MHNSVKNLLNIENQVKSSLSNLKKSILPKIIAVSKTFNMEEILPLIEHGHIDFGENKVQEAINKWTEIKKKRPNLQLTHDWKVTNKQS